MQKLMLLRLPLLWDLLILFFVVLRHLYSLLVVLQYSAPDSPPMTPLWREEECGKVVTNKFNGAIFAFVRFGEKERQVNKPECKL